MRLTIRRKLFLGFLAVIALPLGMLVANSRSYLRQGRLDLERQFNVDASASLRRLSEADAAERQRIRDGVHEWLKDERLEPGSDEIDQAVIDLKRKLPEIDRIELRRGDDKRVFSDIDPNDDRLKFFTRMPHGVGTEMGMAGMHLVMVLGNEGEGDGALTVMVVTNDARTWQPEHLYKTGVAYIVSMNTEGDHKTFKLPEGAAGRIPAPAPDWLLARLAEHHGGVGTFWHNGEEYRVYADLTTHKADVAVAPEREIFAELIRMRRRVVSVVAASILFAIGLAYILSVRLTSTVAQIKEGMHAISRGEWKHLEKASQDEIGGELIESVNRMARTLQARTRREEIENWRGLVRVLSHEINNTLGPVRSVAATIRDRIVPRVGDADAGEDLKMASRLIVERVDALTGFISGYADLAKLPEPERVPVDVNQLVQSAARVFESEARKKLVQLSEQLDGRVASALLDPKQVERVVINLVKNAIEAAPPGGAVTVRTFRPGQGRVELCVEDNGPGIAPDARKNLFVPYFTTKAGGSGIGLALVRQIVLGHGGVVTAEQRPGGGTVMRVVLPAAGEAA
jgi:signal transduction histidine kinase